MALWKRKQSVSGDELAGRALVHPERVTTREYYGAVIGIRFEDDLAAAEHYLADGWREGVVPHPFLDRPLVRSSMDAAVTLRNELRRIASGTEAYGQLGSVAGIVDVKALRESRLGRLAGDAADFIRAETRDRDGVVVHGGMRWGQLRQVLAESTHVVGRIEELGLFDLEHYAPEHSFLTWRAALDHYLTVGERTGLTPNWAFEPEWHAVRDRGQARGPRSFNQLFHYVVNGERTRTTPMDSSGKSLAELLGGDPEQAVFPAGGGRSTASAALAAERAAATDDLRSSQGRRVAIRSGEPLDVAVIVDGRHLVADTHYEDLRTLARTQDAAHRAVFVICDADDGHEPPLSTLFDEERLEFRNAALGEPLGSVAGRIIDEGRFAAWTMWRPGQQWKPGGLVQTSRALDEYPSAAGVGAYTPHAPQQWGDLESALWSSRLDAAGIIFRADRVSPDRAADYGVNADAVVRLAASGDGVVVEGDRFWARAYDRSAHANRAGANYARRLHLAVVESTLPADSDVTVVMPTFQDWRMTFDAVEAVRATSEASVIIIDNGSRRAVGAILRLAFLGDPRVQYVRLPVNTDFAVASDIGARIATSERIVFLNNDTLVQPGWLDALLAPMDEAAAVQPLLLFADRTVQSAGTVFTGGLSSPKHLLSGFHPADIPLQVGEYDFSALTAACLAVDRADYLAVGGFDAEYVNGMEDVDLCLRLRHMTGRPLRLALDSTVIHLESKTEGRFAHAHANRHRFAQLWRNELIESLDDRGVLEGSTLRLAGVRWADQRGFALREPVWCIERSVTLEVIHEPSPRLRWALKISSPGTALGDIWGDTFFAEDLAAALRRLGQEVVVDRTSSWDRPDSAAWDDVTLTLRGMHRFTPQPFAVNLLWVISHPDKVTDDELRSGWDRVYAAGPEWARIHSERTGVEVVPLLQATDPSRFRQLSDSEPRDGVLFVGRTRGERRPVVLDASTVVDDLRVYGDDGWERYLSDEHIRGPLILNERLPLEYARARVLLNDHWPDMRRGGFLSNRLFDAAAAGARIVSDDIPGLSEVFGEQVRTYRDLDELRSLLAVDSTEWPADDVLQKAAAGIAELHSFDARARRLVEDALTARSMR